MECEKCKVEFIYVELCPLHAAAPELLEALKGLMGYYANDLGQLPHLLKIARLAISRAEDK